MKFKYKYWGFTLPNFNKIMGFFAGYNGIVISGKKFIGFSYHLNTILIKPWKLKNIKHTEKVLDLWFYLFFCSFMISFRFGRKID